MWYLQIHEQTSHRLDKNFQSMCCPLRWDVFNCCPFCAWWVVLGDRIYCLIWLSHIIGWGFDYMWSPEINVLLCALKYRLTVSLIFRKASFLQYVKEFSIGVWHLLLLEVKDVTTWPWFWCNSRSLFSLGLLQLKNSQLLARHSLLPTRLPMKQNQQSVDQVRSSKLPVLGDTSESAIVHDCFVLSRYLLHILCFSWFCMSMHCIITIGMACIGNLTTGLTFSGWCLLE